MPSRPVFVTSYFSIYKNPQGFEFRLEKFRQLLQTGIQIVLFTDNVTPFIYLLCEYRDTFRIGYVMPFTETNLYREYHNQLKNIPYKDNQEKDTLESIWLKMLKTEFLERAIRLDVFHTKSSVYVWIDFSIADIFYNPDMTLSFLKTIGNSQLELDTVYIPGCIGEKQGQYFDRSVICRFCGCFILGNTEHLLEMNRQVNQNMPEFIKEYNGTLTWEVNYWAWMEHRGYFQPTWYSSGFDDQILLGIPSRALVNCLVPLFQQVVFPESLSLNKDVNTKLEPAIMNSSNPFMKWTPSNLCFFKQVNEKSYWSYWLLVRYVNYYILDDYNYFVQDINDIYNNMCILKTENVLYKMVLGDDGNYYPILKPYTVAKFSENIESATEFKHSFSIGMEDVRLWTNQQGDTCYIATNINKTPCGFPQIVTGSFEMKTATFSNMTIHSSEHCEKNWIPWSDDEVLYKWILEGIVFRNLITKEERLVPFKNNTTIIPRVCFRSSSIFIPGWNAEERVAVVHYSEDNSRKYYHSIVVLHEKTGVLLRNTMPFYLGKEEGIQFCIGFDWTLNNSGERLFHFWFSVMDRNPQYWVVKEGGGFQWCSY